MADEEVIQLAITGKLSYSDEITLTQAAQIVAFLNSGLAAGLLPQQLGGNRGGREIQEALAPRSSGSPREALDTSGAKTNPERIVAFGLSTTQQGGKDTFTIDEIRPLFRRAGAAAPSNLSRDFVTAVTAGWIAESESVKGEYYVLDRAAGALDSGFDAIREKRGTGGRGRVGSRRSRKAPTVPAVFAEKEIVSTFDGWVDFHKVKGKRDRHLWALAYAKELGVDALSNAELSWLTFELGDGITSNNLNGYYKLNQKSGYVNKNAQGKVRVLPAGVERVKQLNEASE